METILLVEPAGGTHTTQRHWTDTETPKQVVGMKKQPAQSKVSERDVLASEVGILRFVSGDKEHSTGRSRVRPFFVSSTQDQGDAIFEAPGAELWARLRRALLVLALVAPSEELLRPEVMDRLVRCDESIRLERVPSFPSTQLGVSVDKWMAKVRAWASSHPQSGRVVDDSRESIYGDRG